MNETAGTCLAITEKKAHRPGGCVGIFFQLIDWNKRFAKKKLFSRKLLPAARAKQPLKKFGGDEKRPKTKLHLIADENEGGFSKCEEKWEL
ncbi:PHOSPHATIDYLINOSITOL N-ACETYLGLUCOSAMINYLTRANSFERASE SUBUNIT P DOWN SYNDROME CRITICAL REGION PROTEIN 5 -RELATED [Salix viminalis]|uniref:PHOSPHATIDYLINOSITOL N-ACETYLGLUCOSAMINYLTRANSFERASE SUBUNIT P DOWN SYNDROME CRITICAL REGION PROTEIN 5 -RELATED n=1 Tax=Salix viminalis TaxID=40686 RepID=A0A9Q0PA17_SALVM|nr:PHOSPHATIDYLINOSITOL N-ACETYLGLUCOSAMINYLTRANSFERASE SUBUNIT P DOWN SYNDROME CRITICAL REGION PROTEIN 5 -RELATED [Salix viminalis]